MSGFRAPKNPTSTTQYLIDFVGSDDRCRAYLNPYGSQTGRYQPKATQFIFLKSAWTRGIVQPTPGKVIVGIDYGSQEFLLQGLLGKDKAMLKAYQSGDVYLYFAKLAGAVPWEGTKKEYPEERNLFKAVTLAMGYGMGVPALAMTLSQRLGREVLEVEAKEYKDLFQTTYPDYADFAHNLKYVDYPQDEMLRVKDGWTMFGDNMNSLSVGNFPLQGAGAVIARKAIALCQDAGLNVIFPLHDALYVELDIGDWDKIDLICEKMIEACAAAFEEPLDTIAKELIRLDIDVWGPELEEGEMTTPMGNNCTIKKIYIDPRGKAEYEKYSKYFKEV
jgi:DNA polymerase I